MKLILIALAFGAFVSLSSCQKCTANSSCTKSGYTQADIDAATSLATLLLNTEATKKAVCASYTASQSSGGTGCTIAWQ